MEHCSTSIRIYEREFIICMSVTKYNDSFCVVCFKNKFFRYLQLDIVQKIVCRDIVIILLNRSNQKTNLKMFDLEGCMNLTETYTYSDKFSEKAIFFKLTVKRKKFCTAYLISIFSQITINILLKL